MAPGSPDPPQCLHQEVTCSIGDVLASDVRHETPPHPMPPPALLTERLLHASGKPAGLTSLRGQLLQCEAGLKPTGWGGDSYQNVHWTSQHSRAAGEAWTAVSTRQLQKRTALTRDALWSTGLQQCAHPTGRHNTVSSAATSHIAQRKWLHTQIWTHFFQSL